jgi:hypothetical protein
VVGKAAADVAWYGMEASARWGVTRSAAARQPTTPYRPGGTPSQA